MIFKAGKRGQVTLFVIAAVIAVSVVSIFFMFRTGIVKAPMSTEQANQLLSSKSENLRDYTSECIEQISDAYFQEVLSHGGYYKYGNLNSINYLDNDNVILLYKKDNELRNELPSLNSICGTGFENYLNEEAYSKLDSCLKDFDPFKMDMDINPSSERKIEAECRDDDIVIKTDWLFDISRADASSVVQQKNTRLLIPLRKMWIISNDILIDEAQGDSFAGGEIENYLSRHENSLDHILLESWVVTGDKTVQHVTSQPYRPGEVQNKFIFAHDTPLI